jgi:hypothetical protein
VTRPELWETKISWPATLDECIGDLHQTRAFLSERRVYVAKVKFSTPFL